MAASPLARWLSTALLLAATPAFAQPAPPIYRLEIRDTIQTYARNQMYSAVLDVSGQTLNGIETVLYTEPRMDITGEIIDVLNRGRPADLAAKTNAATKVSAPALPDTKKTEKK